MSEDSNSIKEIKKKSRTGSSKKSDAGRAKSQIRRRSSGT